MDNKFMKEWQDKWISTLRNSRDVSKRYVGWEKKLEESKDYFNNIVHSGSVQL
jgi:hypothetical protein